MKDIIVIYYSYKPNTAPINRLLSFLHGFDDYGIEAEMVFLYPDEKANRADEFGFNHVHFSYLWKQNRSRNKYYKFLLSFFDVIRFVKRLSKGSKVLLISSSSYLPFIIWRKDIEVYHERTEHPYVAKTFPHFLQRSYLRACRKTKGLFVISTALGKYYQGIGVKNVSIVNMTVDDNRFNGIVKRDAKEHYIAYCGAASNNKDGVDILIKAFSIVHGQYPDLKLYVLGKAPKEDDETGNLNLVAELGIKDAVVFKGLVPAEQMPQLLVDADMLALARPDSLQAQCGFPTKLGEYLLTGNPVVVTSVGDIPVFLKNGENALIAEPGNVDDFADKMIWVINHSEEAKRIGLLGKETALKCFNYRTETKKIIEAMNK